jgi:hypothetical protein
MRRNIDVEKLVLRISKINLAERKKRLPLQPQRKKTGSS